MKKIRTENYEYDDNECLIDFLEYLIKNRSKDNIFDPTSISSILNNISSFKPKKYNIIIRK